MNKLLDDYQIIGTDLTEFRREIIDIANRTRTNKTFIANKYSFYSICNITDEKITLIEINERFLELFSSFNFELLKSKSFIFTVNKAYLVKNFSLKETENLAINGLLMVDENKKMVLISRDAYKTMFMRTGLGGEAMLEPCLARNILLAKKFYDNDDNRLSTVVSRVNIAGYEKIMATLSDGYCKIPQTILVDIIDEIENIETLKVISWKITNRISSIYLLLTDKDDDISTTYNLKNCTPGIYLATSDTGDCSITVKAFFRFGKSSIATVAEFNKKHEGNIKIDEIMKEINFKLFPKFFIIPKRLTELMLIDIDDPEKALVELLKYINLVSLIGKKNEVSIKEQLISEIDTTSTYTGYDICMMALTIPERIENVKADVKKKLEAGIIKAVDYNYPTTKISVAYLQD